MKDYLAIFGTDIVPRLIGIVVALLVTWGAQHGIDMDAKELTAAFVAIYAVVHRLLVAPKAVAQLRAQRANARARGLTAEQEFARRDN